MPTCTTDFCLKCNIKTLVFIYFICLLWFCVKLWYGHTWQCWQTPNWSVCKLGDANVMPAGRSDCATARSWLPNLAD